ncbi:MAG TPA: PQQ-binding-like beta-propeller repeat protein [Bryobacteraceae bacterium]|nr:PQQ-binding-like beta-propeller repeat protein [Bryobacteraceae bacterium]
MSRLFLLFCFPLLLLAGKPEAAWTLEANGDVRWHKVTAIGTYLFATDAGLYSVDTVSGQYLWKREDMKKVPEFAVEEVPGTPVLFVADDEGRVMKSTKLSAIDIMTGQTVWETEKLQGMMADLVPDYSHNAVVLFSTLGGRGKLQILHLDMVTGKANWDMQLEAKTDLYYSEKSGRFIPRMDLNGHAQPSFHGDAMYVAYAGLHKINVKTGKQEWGYAFDVTEKSFKHTNASPLVANGLVYSSAKGVIRAYDDATGALKFTSADFGAAIPEMLFDNGTVYGRMGGVFLDPTKREYSLKKPVGVVALDAATGQLRWRYEGAKDSVTNMHLDRASNSILIADAKNLIALSLDATGNKVKETYKLPLEFKFKSGGGKKAAKMAGRFALGGVRGLAQKDKSGEDEPIALIPRADGTIIVRGKQHLLQFDPKARQTGWGSAFKAPGISNFAKVATIAAFAMQYGASTAQAANTYWGTSENRWANEDRFKALKQFDAAMAKRFSANAISSKFAYMLTDVNTPEGDGPGIVGINLANGEPERELYFKDREPDYVVDELSGTVIRTHKGKGAIVAQVVD